MASPVLQLSTPVWKNSSRAAAQHWGSLAQLQNHIRHCSSSINSTSSTSSSTSSSDHKSGDVFESVYTGYFGKPHKRLKYASLLNTFASFAAAPLIISFSSASPIARVAVTTSVIAFAVITTGGLHWFTSPYVHQMLFNRAADRLRVQTLSMLGGSRWSEFPVSAVSQPTGYHPLASFKAGGRVFYIDRGNFHDVALLQRLVPASDVDPDPVEQQQQQTEEEQQAQELGKKAQ